MKKLFVLIAILFSASILNAQTLSPVTTSCGKKCSASFSVTSNALVPLNFTVEAYHTDFDSKGPHYSQLLSTEHIELGTTSGRLSPREQRTVDFKLACDSTDPCTVAIFFIIRMGKTPEGVATAYVLTHQTYSCQKANECRTEVLKTAGLLAQK